MQHFAEETWQHRGTASMLLRHRIPWRSQSVSRRSPSASASRHLSGGPSLRLPVGWYLRICFSSPSTVTRLRAGRLWGPSSLLSNGYRRVYCGGGGGVQRQVREPDHWSPSSAEVKNAWSYTSTAPRVMATFLTFALPLLCVLFNERVILNYLYIPMHDVCLPKILLAVHLSFFRHKFDKKKSSGFQNHVLSFRSLHVNTRPA
jgi:hypothetical protein